MATPRTAARLFPPTLASVLETERIVQCFGWMYGYLGVLAIAASLGAVFANLWKEFSDQPSVLGMLAVLVCAGPILLWWEFRRRAHRTTLIVREGVIGIYRGGRFIQTMMPQDVKVRRSLSPGVRRATALVPVCIVTFLAVPFFDRDFWASGVVGGLLLIGGLSAVRTTFRLAHCTIPGPKYPQDLLLDKNEIRRLAVPES